MGDTQNNEDLDPELVMAIDGYLLDLRTKMLKRVRKGEDSYHGQWKVIPVPQLLIEATEESDDWHVYMAMVRWRERDIDSARKAP